jgi:hypothetical protein
MAALYVLDEGVFTLRVTNRPEDLKCKGCIIRALPPVGTSNPPARATGRGN